MVPDENVLKYVYSKIVNGHLDKFDGKPFRELGDRFVKALVSFYN